MKTELKIKNWYMKSQYIPKLGSIQFAKFAAHGFALMKEINNSEWIGYKVDPLAPTAYFDTGDRVIALPGWYFIPEAIDQLSSAEDPELDALALINGSTIHESLHSVFTKVTLFNHIQNIQRRIPYRVSQNLVSIVANVVEDIYIENSRSLNAYQIEWLAAKNDLLFNDKVWAELVETMDKNNPLSVANAMCAFKRKELQEKLAWLIDPKIVKLLEVVRGKNTLMSYDEKVKAVISIIKLLIVDSDESKAETKSTEAGDGASSSSEDEPYDGEENPGDGKDGMELVDPHYSPAENPSVELAKAVKEAIEGCEIELKNIALSFAVEAKKLGEIENDTTTLDDQKDDLEKLRKNLLIVDVSKVSRESARLCKIELTNRFVNLLKQMRTVVPQRGRGKLSGGKIDVLRLHQVAIDNKVFSVRSIERSGNNDKVEIIIMVDASGSMDIRRDGVWSLYKTCLGVSRKIFMALIGTNIPTQVYAHTSYQLFDYPLLIKIADNFTKNFQEKFELASNIELRENLDGIIIEELVNKHFSLDTRTQKILLVLSDGSPQAPLYRSDAVGKRHTKSIIGTARKSGVKIYSLSLIKDIVRWNNELYGCEYNIDASENLDREMVNLVTRLVRRK